jgi:hypothetical protein
MTTLPENTMRLEQCPAEPIVPPPELGSEDGENERERLLRIWRLHPEALVDLSSEEELGGPDDGIGWGRMTDTNGTDIDEFRFASGEEADDAVDFALRAMNPGIHQ